MANILTLAVNLIDVGEHSQRMGIDEEAMSELAGSMRRIGMLAPLVVAKNGDRYTLVAGHRRLAAAKMAEFEEVPVIVTGAKDERNTEVCFAENFFRKDLSPVELACAINDVYAKGVMTVKEIGYALHRSESWVTDQLVILNWPEDVLQCVHEGWLSVGAARNLARVDDDPYREFLLKHAREDGVTGRTAAAWLQAWLAMQPAEQAVLAEPEGGPSRPPPAVPQAPCICCGQVFRADELSHVPACPGCIRVIREAGMGRG